MSMRAPGAWACDGATKSLELVCPPTEKVMKVTADMRAMLAADARFAPPPRRGEPARFCDARVGSGSTKSSSSAKSGRGGSGSGGRNAKVELPTRAGGEGRGRGGGGDEADIGPRARAHSRRRSKFSVCNMVTLSLRLATCASSSSTYCFLRLRLMAADSRLRRMRLSRLSSADSPDPSSAAASPNVSSAAMSPILPNRSTVSSPLSEPLGRSVPTGGNGFGLAFSTLSAAGRGAEEEAARGDLAPALPAALAFSALGLAMPPLDGTCGFKGVCGLTCRHSAAAAQAFGETHAV
mmetsp:Transcript_7150/g.14607  ORF Transcript_7150/g.14607 Transcript_7150/m.14607 type:complete len:294 (-) Transcript_7150:473-1354(-)